MISVFDFFVNVDKTMPFLPPMSGNASRYTTKGTIGRGDGSKKLLFNGKVLP